MNDRHSPLLRRTARSLPIALLRARETVMAPLREMLAASGVSEQKWRVLRVLEEAGPMDQSLLAEQACLQLPSLTRILRAMEAQGLIARHVDAADRRRSIVAITDAGCDIITRHAPDSIAFFTELEQRYGKKRLQELLDLLYDLNKLDLGRQGRDKS